MSNSDTIPLHSSSQSDIDEIENLINSHPISVLPAHPPSLPRPSIPISSTPQPPHSFISSSLHHPTIPKPTPVSPDAANKTTPVPSAAAPKTPIPPVGPTPTSSIAATGFWSPPNTLTELVWDTVKRGFSRIGSNLKLVVFPNPYREDPGKALRDWDLWGPFFFTVFLGLTLSWSASVKKMSGKEATIYGCALLSEKSGKE